MCIKDALFGVSFCFLILTYKRKPPEERRAGARIATQQRAFFRGDLAEGVGYLVEQVEVDVVLGFDQRFERLRVHLVGGLVVSADGDADNLVGQRFLDVDARHFEECIRHNNGSIDGREGGDVLLYGY